MLRKDPEDRPDFLALWEKIEKNKWLEIASGESIKQISGEE
jgi:hypothetical protein